MSCDNKGLKELAGRFNLLSNLIKQGKTPEFKVDLNKIEKIIREEIPSALKNNAPDDFYLIYADFMSQYDKFRDFILYDKLIGKNVVALGGGFSSGKSSFLNAIMGVEVLPSDIDPSTSVPTFIVQGEENFLQGINIFDTKVKIDIKSIKRIAHGFGKLKDEAAAALIQEDVATGHILESMFLSTPLHAYENIAFLDTPGYSKADSEGYSKKTDEQIARGQLNAANFILWFVQSDAGTITEEDAKFIKTLKEDTPKLFILSKSDKKPENDIRAIISKIKSVLDLKGIRYLDVVAFSNKDEASYDKDKIKDYIQGWNNQIYESGFARNFKILFMRCREFYEEKLEGESRRLNRLNKVRTLSEDSVIIENIDPLIRDIQSEMKKLKAAEVKLKELQNSFFTEIKYIADIVGIAMPEPSEIDLIQDKAQNSMQVLEEYKRRKGIQSSGNWRDLLAEIFADLRPQMDRQKGGSLYKEDLLRVMAQILTIEKEKIKFNHIDSRAAEYQSLIRDR